jgi:hypothetical protein
VPLSHSVRVKNLKRINKTEAEDLAVALIGSWRSKNMKESSTFIKEMVLRKYPELVSDGFLDQRKKAATAVAASEKRSAKRKFEASLREGVERHRLYSPGHGQFHPGGIEYQNAVRDWRAIGRGERSPSPVSDRGLLVGPLPENAQYRPYADRWGHGKLQQITADVKRLRLSSSPPSPPPP